jgi:hypothetical protein
MYAGGWELRHLIAGNPGLRAGIDLVHGPGDTAIYLQGGQCLAAIDGPEAPAWRYTDRQGNLQQPLAGPGCQEGPCRTIRSLSPQPR